MPAKLKKILSGNKKHPEIVTGNFNLHYEDIVQRNRYVAIALVGLGIVLIASVIPVAVYRSLAGVSTASVQPESGNLTGNVILGGDPNAANLSYVQFGTSSANIGLVAAPTTVAPNGTFVVTVQITTARKLTAAQAYVSFNASQLSYVSSDYTGSPLDTSTPDNTTGAGFVRVSRYSTTPSAGGNVLLAKLTFRALTTGSAQITVNQANSSVFDDSGTGTSILSTVTNTGVTVQ